MKRVLTSSAGLLALLSAAPALAGEQQRAEAEILGSTDVGEVVVAATRTPQPLYKIGSSITVLTREAIQSSQTVAVSDLISQLPGVSFSRNGGVGGATALRIRGAEADHTVVIIDGVKLNDPSSTGGGYNSANLLTGDIDRIEVLRGAQSTLWGSQALGGVINIVTALPAAPFQAEAEVEGGSRNTASGTLAAGGASERVVWRLAGSRYITDGHSAYVNGREGDGYQNAGMSGRLRIAATERLSFEARAVYSYAHNQFDGFPAPAFAFADTAEFGKVKELLGYAGVNFDIFEGRLKSRVAYAYTDTDRDNFNPDQAVTHVTFDAQGRNERLEYQGALDITEGWQAVFGAEHEKSSFRTASPSAFQPNPTPAVAGGKITSLYAQLQAEIISDLAVTVGLRYDDHSTFGSAALGQAAAAWSLNDGSTVLRASFGEGFKAPTLFQLYSTFGNTALRPEKADSWDAGIEQHVLEDALTLSATAFYRKTRNQIDFVSCPSANPFCRVGVAGVYDNTSASRAKGVELAASAGIGAFTVQGNYTLTDTENTSPMNPNRGKAMQRRPRHAANVSASYNWPFDVSTGIAVKYVGDAFDNAANSFVLKDYTLVDLRAAWRITETTEVYGRIENVLNEVYATTRNYGTPRRGVFAGVRASF